MVYKFLVKTRQPLYYEIYREEAIDIVMAIKFLIERYPILLSDIIMVQKDI